MKIKRIVDGAWLMRIRKLNNLQRTDMANRIGCSVHTISSWEQDGVTLTQFKRILRALKMPGPAINRLSKYAKRRLPPADDGTQQTRRVAERVHHLV